MQKEKIKTNVRHVYGSVAQRDIEQSPLVSGSSCCGGGNMAEATSLKIGYSKEELDSIPLESNMGLGCGNPQAIASIKPGESVLDLGSGGGLDCFLAASKTGETGKVIGVDMTPQMIEKARKNARKAGVKNVEFRLGEIEHLPVEDDSVDVILSNCVINLSPEKDQVFKDTFRVLKKGGRLAISDVVALKELPQMIKDDPNLHSCCIGGASHVDDIKKWLQEAGFKQIRITPVPGSEKVIRDWEPSLKLENFLVSADIQAVKE
ncbi:MAG: arsenite methyltransferase [Deltaproteobacteria bacterium]|nr:arsenite methyltransferase [Deltaproteobacteria bacterium]